MTSNACGVLSDHIDLLFQAFYKCCSRIFGVCCDLNLVNSSKSCFRTPQVTSLSPPPPSAWQMRAAEKKLLGRYRAV